MMRPPRTIRDLAVELEAALEAAFGTAALPNPSGWRRQPVRTGHYSMGWVAVAPFVGTDEVTVCFIVAPKDPDEPAFARSRRFDIVYFSEDVPHAEQDQVYVRYRELVDHFAQWLCEWDATP